MHSAQSHLSLASVKKELNYFTSKPSARKHALCASISLTQSGSSSPLNTTHSSRAFLVSGQQQHIFLPDLIPTFCAGGAFGGAGVDCP
mmetsp:Transcript_3868/g.6606  ORF Transcript_3868/g.6606 Transcript_3868/m.6606 type:complete len:88 (-) Transcript_3868:57-320(-)